MTSHTHSSHRRRMGGRRVGVGLLAGALVAGGIALAAATSQPASAASSVSYISIESDGSSMKAVAHDVAGYAGGDQALSGGKKCADTETAGGLLWITGAGVSGSSTGIYGGSMGVAEPKSGNGTSCSQVNTGESLTISLGSRVAKKAVLDVEVQKDVVVTAQPKYNGKNVGGAFVLATGLSTPPAGDHVTTCKSGSTSSSSNNNSSDNCRWTITALFDTLVLTPGSVGQFSVEGGSDWAGGASETDSETGLPTNASYVELAQVCDATNSTVTVSGGALPGDGASYERSTTNADGSVCIAHDTTLTRQDGKNLTLTKPADQPYEQGTLTAVWVADPKTDAVNQTKVSFWPGTGTVPDSTFKLLPWCPDSLRKSDGTFQYLSGVTGSADLVNRGMYDQYVPGVGDPADNGVFQYACVYDRDTAYASGKYATTDKIYILGDAYLRG